MIEKTGVRIFLKNLDYRSAWFNRLKILEKDQVLYFFLSLNNQTTKNHRVNQPKIDEKKLWIPVKKTKIDNAIITPIKKPAKASE